MKYLQASLGSYNSVQACKQKNDGTEIFLYLVKESNILSNSPLIQIKT